VKCAAKGRLFGAPPDGIRQTIAPIMDRERSDERGAGVLARHDRHPLARRIACVQRTAGAMAALLLTALPTLQPARGAGVPASEAGAAHAAPAADPSQPPMKSVDAHGGTVVLPERRPALDEATKAAARAAVADARAAAAANPAGSATAYALASGRLRTPAETEKLLAVLRSVVAQAAPRRGLQVDAMRAGEDWRAVCWPISRREDADHLRELLARRGHRLEIVAF
jgi:hypothetical protein